MNITLNFLCDFFHFLMSDETVHNISRKTWLLFLKKVKHDQRLATSQSKAHFFQLKSVKYHVKQEGIKSHKPSPSFKEFASCRSGNVLKFLEESIVPFSRIATNPMKFDVTSFFYLQSAFHF